MVVIDTSAWIEVLADGPLRPALMEIFPKPCELIVPTIVRLELSKWLKRERGKDKADEIIAFTQACLIEPLDTNIAILAAEQCVTQKLAAADTIIYSTAVRHGARLLTCDAHFERLAGVDCVRKSPD
jgi:uncharacterized protein